MPDMMRGRKWDLVGLRNLWFAISLILIVPGLVAYFTQGLNMGIDFTGGGLVTYQLAEPVASNAEAQMLGRVREAVDGTGVKAQFQFAGAAGKTDQLLVRTRVVEQAGKDADAVLTEQKARLLPALEGVFPGMEERAAEMVSGIVSQELIKRAIYAVALGCVFILFWIRIRYPSFRWSLCALIALLHDVLFLIGVFALTRREVNSGFVAAALTVVGFSVHDTIVIFDRIRENMKLRKGDTFAETVNISLLETMSRSINTGVSSLLVLVVLYFLGGAPLRDITFAMIIGILVGSYSSIFNAAQLLVMMQGRSDRKPAARRAAGRPVREMAERAGTARRPATSRPLALRPVQAAQPAEEAQEEADEESEEGEAPQEAAAGDERTPKTARRKLRAGRKRKRRF